MNKEGIIKFELFTDAASFNNGQRIPSKPQHTCSTGILTYNREIITGFRSFNPNTTNNFGEIYAIYLSIYKTLVLLEQLDIDLPIRLDVYSDSNLCVSGLTKWMKGWKKNADSEGNWYSSTGLVANQEVFKKIDKLVSNTFIDIRIYHIRGHINRKSQKDLNKARKSFKQINGFNIDDYQLFFVVDMNNLCDKYAGRGLKKGMEKYDKFRK